MPRKKEKLIKALQINFNSLAVICDVELWKYTPLAVGMEFEYYGQYDNPRTTNAITITDCVDILFDLTKQKNQST